MEFLWYRGRNLINKKLRFSLIIPAKNETETIIKVLNRICSAITFNFECFIVVDTVKDSTINATRKFMQKNSNFRILINNNELGPAGAIKTGISAANSNIIVVTMADGSDDLNQIIELVSLVERGVVVACASRYMSGGRAVGAPRFKGLLSKICGLSLYHLRNVGTHDSTNSFKAYSKEFIQQVGIQSRNGFEIGLELVSKARVKRLPVAEIPTIWIERQAGVSNFKLFKWLPEYLKWYFYAFKIGGKK
jgi:glycosyltransferase involved in cell wall biosynthesis